MSNAIGRSLLMLIGLINLSGCETTRVNNTTPDPYFLTCSDVCQLSKPGVPDQVIGSEVEQTNVMLKLRDRQDKDNQIKLGGCSSVCK